MPLAPVEGAYLYYEETGQGFPLVFCHEFAGDYGSWEAQVRFFCRRYRVITYNARGYPPSGVPSSLEDYSQDRAVEDLQGLLGHLQIESAHIVGLSMGGSAALNFGFAHPSLARSLVLAGTGTGSDHPKEFRRQVRELAQHIEETGIETFAQEYAQGRTRLPLLRKNPRGWQEFQEALGQHSAQGSALTFRGVQGRRQGIFEMRNSLRNLKVPTLILCGDEDEPCVNPSVFMKRNIPSSGLVMFPQTGHTMNLEEPDLFNRTVQEFLTAVEKDAWARRDPTDAGGYLLT